MHQATNSTSENHPHRKGRSIKEQNRFQMISLILILMLAGVSLAACGSGASRADRTGVGDEEGVGSEGVGVDGGLNFSEETAAEDDNFGADAGSGVNEGFSDDDNLGVGEGPGTTGGLGDDDGLIAEEGVEEDNVLGLEEERSPEETVRNILENPAEFYGSNVAIEAEIGQLIGTQGLTIEEDVLLGEDVLPVLDASGLLVTMDLTEDDAVAVRGRVMEFNQVAIEQEYAIDLEDAVYRAWEGQPVIIASEITPIQASDSGLGG